METNKAENQNRLTKKARVIYLRISPGWLDQVNWRFAAIYPSMEAAEEDTECNRRTISKFLEGGIVRRKHFLNLCKVLGFSPLVLAGAQAAGVRAELPIIIKPRDLRAAEFDEVSALVQERSEAGKIVQITENDSNICRFVSKTMTPERLGTSDLKILKNHNYLTSWQQAGSLQAYFKLRTLLDEEGFAPGYVYRLIRKSDGALVEYATDFYLVRDFMGKEIRLAVSNVEDFQVISA